MEMARSREFRKKVMLNQYKKTTANSNKGFCHDFYKAKIHADRLRDHQKSTHHAVLLILFSL